MADFNAIRVTCDAVLRLLRESYRPHLFEPSGDLRFEVYGAEDFKDHMGRGVSLFLYHVEVNSTRRAPVAEQAAGTARRQPLHLDLHFLITAWAPGASLQHAILGWAMRLLGDNPVLSPSLLNGVREGTFRADETVELITGQLTAGELMRIWDGLGSRYQLSAPYVARVVCIEPLREPAEAREGGGSASGKSRPKRRSKRGALDGRRKA